MDESVLLKISLIFSFLGIASLFLISRHIELTDTTIEKISSGDEGKTFMITGNVIGLKESGKLSILEINETKELEVMVFTDSLNLTAGDNVKITAEKTEGRIIARKIEKIE